MTRTTEATKLRDCSLLRSNSSSFVFRAFFPNCETVTYLPCSAFLTPRLKRWLSWLGKQTGFIVRDFEKATACNRAARVSKCLLRSFSPLPICFFNHFLLRLFKISEAPSSGSVGAHSGTFIEKHAWRRSMIPLFYD